MLIDLTRIERSPVMDNKKYERHSQRVLELIREAGLEDVVEYIAFGETYNLSAYDRLIDIRYMFKPRGYKKQVQGFIEEVKKAKPLHLPKSKTGTKKESIFDILKDIDDIIEEGVKAETDEEMENAVAFLDIRELDKAHKMQRIVQYTKAQQDMVDNIDARIKVLQDRKKRFAKKVENMNKLGEIILNKLGEEKIETPDGDIKWGREGSTLKITGQVPEEYVSKKVSIDLEELLEIIVLESGDQLIIEDVLRRGGFVTETPKKAEIKKAIKDGEKIEFAYIDKTKKGVIK